MIIYNNNQLLALNKPAGIPVQSDKTGDKSLLDLAEIYCKHTVYLIHRIDRPVSGLVLFAKNKKILEIKEPKIYISTLYPGNTAEDIEKLITDPLEVNKASR